MAPALKEIAPNLTRTAVLRDLTTAAGIGQFAAIQAVGSVDTELTVIDVGDADQIGRDVASFAQVANGGLIVTANQFGAVHPDVIVAAAERHKLPAVYSQPYYIAVGGLICYGHDVLGDYRRAAGYVDRILKGVNPADLPVQARPNRAYHQPQGGQGNWPKSASVPARPRRQGNRVRLTIFVADGTEAKYPNSRYSDAMR